MPREARGMMIERIGTGGSWSRYKIFTIDSSISSDTLDPIEWDHPAEIATEALVDLLDTVKIYIQFCWLALIIVFLNH